MTDRAPDETKRSDECKKLSVWFSCPNIKETGGGFSGEQYRCDVCGAAYYLDYEDMK